MRNKIVLAVSFLMGCVVSVLGAGSTPIQSLKLIGDADGNRSSFTNLVSVTASNFLMTGSSTSSASAVTIGYIGDTTPGSEGIRKIGALGGYTLEEFIEDTADRGLARDLPVFSYNSTNLTVSYSNGDVYEPIRGYFHLDPGTHGLTDNAVNYAYWSTNDTTLVQWTTGSRPRAEGNIYLATFVTSLGRIIHVGTAMPVGDESLSGDVAFANIMPSIITEGLLVYPTGTNLTNIVSDSGIEYHNMADRLDHTRIDFSVSNSMSYYGHVGGVWTRIVTNKFPVGRWDNGTNIVPCNTSSWYRGVFVSIAGSGQLTWITPDRSYTNDTQAIAGNDPDLPPGFTPYIPLTTAYVFKGNDTSLRTNSTYWLDRRFMIRRGAITSGGVGGGNTPTLSQVLLAGAGTGGILPSGMGNPVTDDQGASKGYVDSIRNKASTGTAYVDPVNGDDVTGRIEKGSLPFKTIQAAINACAVVASDTRRFLVLCSIGTYKENVTMKPFISLRGLDIEATIIEGQVSWPATYVDTKGTELQIITVTMTNAPACVINAGSDASYIGLRSCALYSTYTVDVAVKSVVQISRGNAELYASCWIELISADIASQKPSCLYYLTTDGANVGKYLINAFSSSHVMRIADLNDTVMMVYCNATTESFFASKNDATIMHLADSTNHVNKIITVAHKQASSESYIDSSVIDVNLSATNDCEVIAVSSTGSVSTSHVNLHSSTIIVPNIKVDHLYYGSSATASDKADVVNSQLGKFATAYPQRYTSDGSAGVLGYVIQHASGDLLLGGGLDLSAVDTGVNPQSGHVKIYASPYAGLEQPYFKDSSGNKLRIGRDSVFNGYNSSGTTMPVGTPVYRMSGLSPMATPIVGRCNASDPAKMPCSGIVVQQGGITNGGVGRVMFYGRTESYFNTAPFASGDNLYVSAVSDGVLTNVAPTTGIKQLVGWVHTSSTNGLLSIQIWEADFLSSSTVAWSSSNTNTVNALTVGGLTKEQLVAQTITYYVWGSLTGPYTNPISRLAQIASPSAESVRTNTYLSVTNGQFLGGLSVSTNESPRTLTKGMVYIHNNLETTSTNDCVIQGTLYIYESDQTTLVQRFDGELVHIMRDRSIHSYDLGISVTNDVMINDENRIMLFRTRLISGWAGDTIRALSQDGYLTRIVLTGPLTGVYASSTELRTEISNRVAGDTNLQAQVISETNRAIVAEGVLTSNLNTVNTNLGSRITAETNRAIVAEATIVINQNIINTNVQTQINLSTNRIKGLEDRSNVWNTASTPSRKFLANVGVTANQTFGSATAQVLYTNVVFNFGGTYSNSSTIARWIPGVSNVMVRIDGAMSVNGASQPVLFQIKLYKNGSLKSTMATRYVSSNNDDWAMPYNYVDMTTTASDFYEVFVTSDKAGQVMLGSGADNWWSGRIVD
jgi:hypothetical protein